MQLIDTHAHLFLDDFADDIDQVVRRSMSNGIDKIVLPNIDSKSIGPLHELSEKYPQFMVPLMGLHPTHVKDDYRSELGIILDQLEKYPYKAIGEIGIDLYWDKSFLEQQIEVFEQQLDAALLFSLPVIIHARDSFNEILNSIRKLKYKGVTGIFHAYTGTADLAREITSKGFLIGIGGILTFKNAHLSEVVNEIDIKHIVLETDSPYLAPVPYRGKRNESSYLIHIVEKLAEIKGLTIEEAGNITSQNAMKLFNI